MILEVIIFNANCANSIKYMLIIKINVIIIIALVINKLIDRNLISIINKLENKIKLINSILIANLVKQSQTIENIFMEIIMEIAKNVLIVNKMILLVFKILKCLDKKLVLEIIHKLIILIINKNLQNVICNVQIISAKLVLRKLKKQTFKNMMGIVIIVN